MIKRIISGLLLAALPFAMLAQPVVFRKVIGTSGYDDGYSVQQTFDKGYIMGGATSSFGDGSTDMYVVKADSMGIPRKHIMIGGINIDRGYSIRQTTDSGFIFLGYTNSFGNGGYDMYLAKIDRQLAVQWTKTYGGTDWDFGYSVKQTSDGGYILCGSTFSYGRGDQDYYLIRTDAAGDTVWTKTYGGAAEDVAKSVIQSSDGGFVITGYSKSFGDTLGDVYTIKTDALGDTLWTNHFGHTGGADYGNEVIETLNHKFVVAGETSSYGSGGGPDALAQEITVTGVTSYIETDGLANMIDNYKAITQDTLGRIAMAGTTYSFGLNGDMFLVIGDSTWGFINATTFGSLEFDGAYSIQPTADKAFILCGVTNSFNNNLDDIYLIKTDTFGLASVPESVFVTSVQDQASLAKKAFVTFPNPANDVVYINMNATSDGDEYELLVSDVLGNVVERKIVTGAPSSVNTAAFANGIYSITLRNKDFSASQKLIVQH